MSPETARRTLELLLSLVVLVPIAAVIVTPLPQLYPTWPSIGPVPVNPELIVPGALGLVAVYGALVDDLGIGSAVTGLLGAITVGLAVLSLVVLAGPGGGVFFVGMFTLAAGVVLAIAVLVRAAVRTSRNRNIVERIRGRLGA